MQFFSSGLKLKSYLRNSLENKVYLSKLYTVCLGKHSFFRHSLFWPTVLNTFPLKKLFWQISISLHNLVQNIGFLGEIGFFVKCFGDLPQLSKFSFRVTGWALVFDSKFFRDFHQILYILKIPNLKSFGNSYTHSVVL